MLFKLEFKNWFIEANLAIDEKNIINILKDVFGFRGMESDDEFKRIAFRDVNKKEQGPKGKEMDVNVPTVIKQQQFYRDLDPSSPIDNAKINALNNLDPVTGTMGDVVDIMVGTGSTKTQS